MKLSKEAQEMDAEELEAEPSLDRMFDLTDPKVLEGLGHFAAELSVAPTASPQPSPETGERRPWTREEMLAAGIPEEFHGVVPVFDSLEEAAAELPSKPTPRLS